MSLLERIVAESSDLIGIRTLLDRHPGDPDAELIEDVLGELEDQGLEAVADVLGEIHGRREHYARLFKACDRARLAREVL